MVPAVKTFQIADYAIFAATIVVSLGIGIYFACSGQRQKTTSEFLVGSRTMKFIPVALSLMASFESSIMMLGLPAEVYVYGSQIFIGLFGFMASFCVCRIVLIPVIHPLKITSAYEYLDARFKSRAVRLLGVFLAIFGYVFYMGIVLLGPALALQGVTGFSQIGTIFLVATAAVMYTAMGGLKAVIWTDVFQAIVMVAGMMAILIKGTIDAGGAKQVWHTAYDGGRLNFFNFDPDPTVRHTFWGLFFGTFLRSTGLVFNQSTIQRIGATPTVEAAKKMMAVLGPAFWVTIVLAFMEGIVAYGYYVNQGCDPLESNRITNPNQLIPYLVMDIFDGLPGMPGLFLAALISASLSTISSGLSSLSAITWEDLVKPYHPNLSQTKATLLAKISVIVFGLMSCAVAVLTSLLGGVLTQIGSTILAAFNGPLCGLFTLGMICPWANAKGALLGTTISAAYMMWLCAGATFSGATRPTPWLPPAPTDRCYDNNSTLSYFSNTTQLMVTTTTEDIVSTRPPVYGINKMYTISYIWLGAIGMLLCILIGFIGSWATGFNRDEAVDPRYCISPVAYIKSNLPDWMKKLLGIKEDDIPVLLKEKLARGETTIQVESSKKEEVEQSLLKSVEKG